jgi:hypothetical protein
VLELSWVGSFQRHNQASRQYNDVPMYSQYLAANLDPTKGALAVNSGGRALDDMFFRPIKGLAGLGYNNYSMNQNYHSLQGQLRRNMSHGVSYSLAYTFGKSMGYSPAAVGYFTDKYRNYGPSFSGAPQVIAASFVYEVPGLAKKLNVKALGVVTDHWSVSGIYNWQSYAMTSVPNITINGTTSTYSGYNFTGSSSDEGARMLIVGDPVVANPTFTNASNSAAFVPPVACSPTNQTLACFGNAGSGSIVKIPTWVNNWDMTFSKNFPLKSERRLLIFRAEMYNIFNHTQFTQLNGGSSASGSGWASGNQYSIASYQNYLASGNASSLVQGNAQYGWYSNAAAPRRMVMSLRFQF